ncbi:MAG: hypothetical protein HON65_06050, partial [Rhodospirillales bacterium]|nr:hypothetical protein [Rhodospirillales bacterium]
MKTLLYGYTRTLSVQPLKLTACLPFFPPESGVYANPRERLWGQVFWFNL